MKLILNRRGLQVLMKNKAMQNLRDLKPYAKKRIFIHYVNHNDDDGGLLHRQ